MKTNLLVLALSAVATLTARANTIVYDDFGPGDTYTIGGDVIGGSSHNEIAAGFIAGASGNVATVDLGLTYIDSPGAVNVYLYGDSGGLPDIANQTLLGTATPTAAFGTLNSVVSFTVGGIVPVTTGTSYWLVLKAAASGYIDYWNFSSQPGSIAISLDDTTWHPIFESPEETFRLTVSSGVPDGGATVLLLALGLGAMFGARRVCNAARVAAVRR